MSISEEANPQVSESAVLIDVQDSIAWITLNRPDSMNTVNRALLHSLDDAVRTVGDNPSVRVVVITGKGRAFCAGGDLKDLLRSDGSIDSEEMLRVVEYGGKVFNRITEIPKPVIAAINGIALAGGLELALVCDLVVAAESARVGDGHANFGLVPGGGGAARLVRVVGPMVAKYLNFTGESLRAADLKPLGLVNEVVPDEDLVSRVGELALCIAAKSATGIAKMKSLINDGLDQSLTDALKAEHAALASQMRSPDMLEGLTAFRERRIPNYTAAV